MESDFITREPLDPKLRSLVDQYFFIDIPVSALKFKEEYAFPFPRITFGYFFEHPFLVTNYTRNETVEAQMVISRISTDRISVRPLTDRIKILGAHIKPYALAFFTDGDISKKPWIIRTEELFGKEAREFKEDIDTSTDHNEMFAEVEQVFLRSLLTKDLGVVIDAVGWIEAKKGNVTISELSKIIDVSPRTLRNHFYRSVGCSPKTYILLVKLRQSIYQMKHDPGSLTEVSYDQNFADQAHFTNTMKGITGVSPKQLRGDLPSFRFLQF